MDIVKVIPYFGKLSVFLQYCWLIWLIIGIILLFLSLNPASKDKDVKNGPLKGTETKPIPKDNDVKNGPLKGTEIKPIRKNKKFSEITIPVKNKNSSGEVKVEVKIAQSTISDKGGNMAKISVSILSKEASWEYESTTDVILNKKPIDMEEFFRSDGMRARFNIAKDIIAVGAASEQGNKKNEEKRAQDRADQLIYWLRKTVTGTKVNFHTLNLGKYKNEESPSRNKNDSVYQRRVVIISITEKDKDIDIKQALLDNLKNNEAWPFNVEDYSIFSLTPAI